MYKIKEKSINSNDAKKLINELNEALLRLTGNTGQHSFYNALVLQDRATFLIGYHDDEAISCGALKPLSKTKAEIKRLYARKNHIGAGHHMVEALIEKAKGYGYQEVYIETRSNNLHAIDFYHDLGFVETQKYGKYLHQGDAICMKIKV